MARYTAVNSPQVKQESSWPGLEAALQALADEARLPPSTFAIIADRLRGAIEAPDAARVAEAAGVLERFYRHVASHSTRQVQDAARGVGEGDLTASYVLGKLAFAQLLAARIADTRAGTRFLEHIRDPRYVAYVRALGHASLNVAELQGKVGERIETVSRKLGVLRELGIVTSRKHGTTVVNMLTPSARQLLDELPPGGYRSEPTPTVAAPAARKALEAKREALPDHLKRAPNFASDRVFAPPPRQAA
jgi:DNA-binding transcriptional ArsR family regulator